MYKLSAFADEVSDDLDAQLRNLKSNGVQNIELRGVWGKNVLKLSAAEVREVKRKASESGVGFSAVGSPLGKFPLSGDFSEQLDGLKRALEYAEILEARYIRMFSFHIPKGDDPSGHRAQVLDWLGRMVAEAEKTKIVLAHENEKGIYGDTGDRCADLFGSIKSKSLTGIFDFANFVQCGESPYECWRKLRSHIAYFHVKDALLATGKVVPAGRGNGDIEKILGEAFAAGFDNFLTLEPHLSIEEASYGKTSPALFRTACDALGVILARLA